MSDDAGPGSTVLVVDHRGTMSIGWRGETALDCCRRAALDVLVTRRRRSVPVGLATLSDEGLSDWRPPSATPDHYDTLRHLLQRLAPSEPTEPIHREPAPPPRPPLSADRMQWALRGDESPFATTIRSLTRVETDDRRRVNRDELPGVVQFVVDHVSGSTDVVLFTDDGRPEEVRTAVDLASNRGTAIAVYLAPRGLFEPRSLVEAATTYREYERFDRLRRELGARPGVCVREVAPI